jgi:hypothetical protein
MSQQKYTAFRAQRTRVSNRLAGQKHTAHKAEYPICGLQGGLRFCRSIAAQHRTVMIDGRVSSSYRRPATNWLRVIEDEWMQALLSSVRAAFKFLALSVKRWPTRQNNPRIINSGIFWQHVKAAAQLRLESQAAAAF